MKRPFYTPHYPKKRTYKNKKKYIKRGITQRHNKRFPTVVIGLIHANEWCGHCKTLEPIWKALKQKLYEENKNPNKYHYVIHEIDSSKEENKAKNDIIIKGIHHELPRQVNGFPTLFRIEKGKLVMFSGSRDMDTLYKWSRGNTSPLKEKENGGIFGNIFGGYLASKQTETNNYNISNNTQSKKGKKLKPKHKKPNQTI